MSRPVAIVTGAGGGIGSSLCRALRATHEVRGLFRAESAASRELAAAGGTVLLGALAEEAAMARWVGGADVVFHCAAMMRGFSADAFRAVNVDATRALARAARAHGCRRFVHVSSAAVYAAAAGASGVFSETLELRDEPALDAYSRSKVLGERAVAEALGGGPTELTIVRPTCVYGPGIASWTLGPLEMLRKGQPFFFGLDAGEGRMNAIHVDDLVAGLVAAAESAGAAGGTFNFGHHELSFREFYEPLAAMIGAEPAFSTEARARKLARTLRTAARWIGPAREMSRGLEMALRMSLNTATHPSDAARAAFGFAPRMSLAEGMLATELGLRGRKLPPARAPIWNCDRHYALRPRAVVRPGGADELADLVRAARRARQPLKPIGRLHTFAPVPETDGVVIDLKRMSRVLAIEGDLVTAQGGITLAELNRELARYGLLLPTQGSFIEQSLAGAIATATHGGSLQLGTLSDYVEGIELVRADGERVTLRRGDADFGGAVVSLGLLGIVASVTLRCVPEFHLRAEPSVVSCEEFLREFDAIQRGNEFVDARYYPQIGQVEVLRMNRVARPAPAGAPRAARAATPGQRRMVSAVFRTLLRGAAAGDGVNRALVRKLLGTTYRACAGRADEILAFTDLSQGEPFPIDDLELAVPYPDAHDALRALAAHFRGGGRMPVFFPIHLRCSRAGEQWLGANHGQDVCWLEFWHYPPQPALYAEIARVLAPFGPRYHLGKLLPPGAPGLNLPRWADFLALRKRFDPEGALLNRYAEGVLGIAR